MNTHQAPISSKELHNDRLRETLKLDEEILQLQWQIQALRAKRNALLPVSTIPTDVLVDIFKFVVAREGHRGVVTVDRTVDLTRVCSSWRNIALDHPTLWTHISSRLSARWKQVFLQRSKQAHISIGLDNPDLSADFMETITLALPRTRDLAMHYEWGQREEPLLTFPAPVLRSLKLRGFQLDQQLFCGVAPNLITMELHACQDFRFQEMPFARLTELKVTYPRSKLFIHDWVIGLASFPNLKELTVHHAVYNPFSFDLAPLPYVDLPNLRRVQIQEDNTPISIVSEFLCHISGHRDMATLVVSSELVGNVPAYIHLLNHLHAFDPPRLFSLYISTTNFNLKAFTSTEDHVVTSIDLSVRWLHREDAVQTLRQLPLRTLSSMTLLDDYSVYSPFQSSLWSETLSTLPHLQRLELGTMYAVSFILYLASLREATPSAAPGIQEELPSSRHTETLSNTPFPSLHSLSLIWLPSYFWDELPLNRPIVRSFYEVLAMRKESGVGLGELLLKDCDIFEFGDLPLASCADRVQKSRRS